MSAKLLELISLARLRASVCWPQLADAVWALRGPIAVPDMDALAGGAVGVDVDWRLYVDPEAAAKFTLAQMATVLVHEAWHCLRDHAERAQAAAIPAEWRAALAAALDAEVNGDMERCAPGPYWPYAVHTPETLNMRAGLPWEEYYPAARKLVGPQSGRAAGGSCMDGERRPWELPANDASASRFEQDTVRRAVAQAIASSGGHGRLPAGMLRWAAEILAAPKVPWRQVLAGALRGSFAVTAGAVDYSRQRPSRRQAVTPVRLAALARPEFVVDVVVDTSGSMGEAELHAALSEVEGIIKSAGAEVRVYACDAAVHGGTQRVRRAADVRLSGGGGTDMGAGLAFAAKQLPCAAATVVITDGWSPWPVQRPAQRVIVALVGAACAAPQTAPEWARVVEAADGA